MTKKPKLSLCNEVSTSARDLFSNSSTYIQSPLLQLPLELRRMIYQQSILSSRSPRPEQVYENNLNAVWKDLPSPLLHVNKQIRYEVWDLLQKTGFNMRVTSHGANFDAVALSSFIAQQRPKSYAHLPILRINIWPPHPDRPIEIYNIWNHIRELREGLCIAQRIPNLIISFKETETIKWCQNGKPPHTLTPEARLNPKLCDIGRILDHFAFVANVDRISIFLPRSLTRNEWNDRLRWHAWNVSNKMCGEATFSRRELYVRSLDAYTIHVTQPCLKEYTAEIARERLICITRNGSHKMSDAEWSDFTRVWPHFEVLNKFSPGGPFEGEAYFKA